MTRGFSSPIDTQHIQTFVLPETKRVFEDPHAPQELLEAAVGFMCVNELVRPETLMPGLHAETRNQHHHRSFVFDRRPRDDPITDQYGEAYFVASAKGAVIDNPKVEPYDYERYGFRIYGLQEGKDALDAITKSQYLRSLGVQIEWVYAADHPTKFPNIFTSDASAPPLLSRRLFMHALEAVYHSRTTYGYKPLTTQMRQDLNEFSPFVTHRLQKSALRPWDLDAPASTAARLHFIDAAIRDILPTYSDFTHDYTPQLHTRAQKNEFIENYFLHIFAPQLGRNIAKLHEYGFKHGYLHCGNVSLAGELVDSESVQGAFPWIQTPKTFSTEELVGELHKFLREFRTCMRTFMTVISGTERHTVLHNIDSTIRDTYVKKRVEAFKLARL